MENDVILYRTWQKSPIAFVSAMWSLTPQDIKPEYKDVVDLLKETAQWQEFRAEYFEPFIKGKHLTWQQWVMLLMVEHGIQGGNKKISIVSGHGTSKTSTVSLLILWYLFCFKDSQVGATAPTSDQIHTVLWKELSLWLGKMPQQIACLYEWSNGYLRIIERPNTWFARAKTAGKDNPEAMAGFHGEYVFLIFDEASGIDDVIFRSAEGSLTGENTLVMMISNGTRNEGYFYNTHHDDKNNWQTLELNSEDSPIVKEGYIQRIESLYGRESDEFNIRVRGKFPSSEQMDQSGWIPLITDAQITQVSDNVPFVGKKAMGIDPSGEGDDSSIWVLRDRFQARVVGVENTSNEKTVAKKTLDILKESEVSPEEITTDGFGIGMNVSRELLLLDHQMSINAINWGEKAEDEVYANRKAELCFRGRDWLIRGGAIAGDELKRDILSYKYKNQLNGKKIMMPKVDQKKLLGRSPDRGDAFFLSFLNKDATEVQGKVTRNGTNINIETFDPFAAL